MLGLAAWGALAFGAVYPWAYVPLLAGGALVGAASLIGRHHRAGTDGALVGSLALLAFVIGLQRAVACRHPSLTQPGDRRRS